MTRSVIVALTVLLTAGLATAGLGSSGADVPQIDILEQSAARTVLEVTIPGIDETPVVIDGQEFFRLSLPGDVMATIEEGKPQVPKVSVLLAIPTGARVSARATVLETETFSVGNVYPLQPPLLDGEEPGAFVINSDFYSQDVNFPGIDLRVIETGVWRDLHVANLQVYPVQVNPARGEVTLATKVRIEVDYSGGSYPASVPDWNYTAYAAFIDNFSELRLEPRLDYDEGVRYLVFCHQTYGTNSMLHDSLLGWVKKRGYDTRVITKSSFTAAEVKDSIHQEYGRHTPPLLQYVLLVGEYAQIPTGSYSGVGKSDFYYMDIDPYPTGDNYPEVNLARLSPSSVGDLENQIAKILKYQKDPAGGGWLDKLTLVAHREQYPAKYSGCVRGVYNMPKPYWNPTMDTIMGQYKNNTDVTSAVNAGVGILAYRGHGNATVWSGWCGSNWTNANVAALANGDMTPVTQHWACICGDISVSECHAEAWLRKYPGGAVSALAATQASYTYPNHGQCSTVVRAMTDTWTITVPGVRDYVGPQFSVAGQMSYMDAYLAKYWPGSPYYYNIYMYLTLGDPSMPVWAGTPGTPVVTYPDSIPTGPYNMPVAVSVGGQPVEGALVCVWKPGDFYVVERTDADGEAVLATMATAPGMVYVTVSEGHAQHSVPGATHTPIYPHEGTTMAGGGGVTIPDMRYVGNVVDDPPPGGNNNHRFDPGENGTIIVTLRNAGNGMAENVTGILRSDNNLFEIVDSLSVFGDVPAGSTVTNDADRFGVSVDNSIPPGTMVNCTLVVHADSSDYEWTYTFRYRIGEPPEPPGTIIWGPKVCPGMPTQWGLYGLAHRPDENAIYCVYFMSSTIYKYSDDSLLTQMGTVAIPEDSCTGIDYCDYDGNFWLVATASKKVYKITPTGTVVSQFNIPYVHYPVGITEHEEEHTLYISDRRDNGIQPLRIFVTDTLGTVLDTIVHPLGGNYGTRCLALEWPFPVDNVPYLLNMFSWFNAGGTALDSCCMYQMERSDGSIQNSFQFSNTEWNMRGVEFDRHDGNLWATIMQWTSNPSNQILKVVGFTQVGISEGPGRLPEPTNMNVQVRPNPFAGVTHISALPASPGPVTLLIYDGTGRLVRQSERTTLGAGRASFEWNGTDMRGRQVAPGIYFYRIHAGTGQAWGKLVLSR